MKRNTALNSTFTNEFDIDGTLTRQSLAKAQPEPLRRLARGVLVAIGIALCNVPYAGGSENVLNTYTPKEYAYYSLDNIKEYKCLASLYGKESAWNYNAASGNHYGIPQGRSDYLLTANPYEQIDWGIDYINNRYGSMCNAWIHWQKYGWH
jgi:hypothetical protein